MRAIVSVGVVLLGCCTLCPPRLGAAERHLDFSRLRTGETPPGFRSTVSGEGRPGRWVIAEEAPAETLAPADATPSVVLRDKVLAQEARQAIDEHFPLLVLEDEVFGDFKLSTRFKLVSGALEQMAGIAFRFVDEKNFYVIRASGRGNTFRFYKVVEGTRSSPIGPEIPVAGGVWHEFDIECKGNEIRGRLNGRELISVTDNTFTEGRIAFWTKSDSVSYFDDTRIVYAPKEMLARELVRKAVDKYPRLLGLQIHAKPGDRDDLIVVASSDPADLDRQSGEVEQDVATRGVTYWGKDGKSVRVTLPLRDRNGDSVAAVRVILRSFPGQTEANALARAQPIVKEMESRVRSAKDLTR